MKIQNTALTSEIRTATGLYNTFVTKRAELMPTLYCPLCRTTHDFRRFYISFSVLIPVGLGTTVWHMLNPCQAIALMKSPVRNMITNL